MVPWQKPENALRRATELLEVGRKQDALEALHDVIKNRRLRNWTSVHEQIMLKHLELCVELRKPHLAKDGLFQYRNMCQQVNSKSLEEVIQFYLDLSEKKAEKARIESQGLVEDVEDLDQAESPEKLLLSAVSGEGAQERSDRTVLSPWLRFLWESYRQCLELLRNNTQVEALYHKVAKQAFNFCRKFQRKAEFRKLCDNLRTHLMQIQKAQHHAHYALKLSNPDTLALHQETRLYQLDIAIQMELWQESFKSVEDVHQLMQLSKKQARSSALASYYEKLALIFWKAESTLYHAAALARLFSLTKELKKSPSPEDLSQLATRVLLAVLSVGVGSGNDLSRHLEMDEVFLENQRRLATFILLPVPPTRQSLLKEVARLNIVPLAMPIAQRLYTLFETDFAPLTLAADATVEFDAISASGNADHMKYLAPLKEVAGFKILKQVSQVYSTATFAFLGKIMPFYSQSAIERLIVTYGKKALIQVRLQHRSSSVEFGLNDMAAIDADSSLTGTAPIYTPQGAAAFGGSGSASDPMRQYLQHMYTALADAVLAVDDERCAALADRLYTQKQIYAFHKDDQHQALMMRKGFIEEYKENNERLRSAQEERQKEHQRRTNEEKQRQIETRLQQEIKERQEQQKQREQEDVKKRIVQDRIDKMKDPKLRKIIENLPEEELKNLDQDLILQKQISHLEKEKKEHLNRLKQQEKKWDYFVRAVHAEELALRQQEYEKWAVDDKDDWENLETERIERAFEDHRLLVSTVQRLKRMESDASEVIAQVKAARLKDYEKRFNNWEKLLRETRQRRLEDRRNERKTKRRAEWLQQKQENERKKKEEEERLKREQESASRKGPSGGGDQRFSRRGGPDLPSSIGESKGGADSEKWEKVPLPSQTGPNARGPVRRPAAAAAAAIDEDTASSRNWRDRPSAGPEAPPSSTDGMWRAQNIPRHTEGAAYASSKPPADNVDWRQRKQPPPGPPTAVVQPSQPTYQQKPVSQRETGESDLNASWRRQTTPSAAAGRFDSPSQEPLWRRGEAPPPPPLQTRRFDAQPHESTSPYREPPFADGPRRPPASSRVPWGRDSAQTDGDRAAVQDRQRQAPQQPPNAWAARNAPGAGADSNSWRRA